MSGLLTILIIAAIALLFFGFKIAGIALLIGLAGKGGGSKKNDD